MCSPLCLKYHMNVVSCSHDHNKFSNCDFFFYINTKFELSKVIEVKSCIKYNVIEWVRVYSLNIASEKALLTYYHCDRMLQLAVAQIYEWIQ